MPRGGITDVGRPADQRWLQTASTILLTAAARTARRSGGENPSFRAEVTSRSARMSRGRRPRGVFVLVRAVWTHMRLSICPGERLVSGRHATARNDEAATEDRWRISVEIDFLTSFAIDDEKIYEIYHLDLRCHDTEIYAAISANPTADWIARQLTEA